VISPCRRIAALLSTFVVAVVATLGLATAPANAVAYRFWSYWQGSSGQWVAATTGPDGYTVVDQDVQGWRFGIATSAPETPPDNAADFAALCPAMATGDAPVGQVRVAVVVDSGFAADAPGGQTPPADTVDCVTLPTGSTGSQALAAAATVTDQNGLVCAVDGFPADECSAEVSDADAAAAAQAAATESPNPAPVGTTSDSSSAGTSGGNVALLTGLGVVALVALLIGVVVMNRRRLADVQE
jgi:hypothetical protein